MNRNKSFLIASAFVYVFCSAASADNLKNNFQSNLNHTAIDALTKDMGSLVGGGSFHTGKSLGFPVGFDVGVHVPVIRLQDNDAILLDDASTAHAGYAQLEVGLPAKIGLIARGGKINDAKVLGGGIRYGIFSPSVPLMPSLSISGLYDKVNHDYFDAHTISANLVLSVDVPFIRPYLGAGYDWTKLDVNNKAYEGAPSSAIPNLDSSQEGYRAELGVNISVIPFTYVTLAAGKTNGKNMFHAGLGVTF